MSGLHKFLICVLSVVVAVSLGVTVYYFARNNGETLSLSETVCYENVGEEFTITINQQRPNSNTRNDLKSSDDKIVECTYRSEDGLTYKFRALKAGYAFLNLITTNEKFSNLSCKVEVADGSLAFPYFIREYNDLANIDAVYGLDKNYKQIANIDASGKPFAPIASTGEFAGSYDGQNFAIQNLGLTGNVNKAALFANVKKDARISNVVIKNANFKTNSAYIGGVAAVSAGNVVDCAVENSNLENLNAAGVVGGVVARNEEGSVISSSFSSTSGSLAGGDKLGGVAAENISGTVSNCYARGEFKPAATSKMGGVVAFNIANADPKAKVVECYSTMINVTTTNSNVAMIIFHNENKDGTTSVSTPNENANRVYGNHYATNQGYAAIYGAAADANVATELKTENKGLQATYTTIKESSPAIWDFAKVWNLDASQNDGYPTLRAKASDSVNPVPAEIVVPGDLITTPAQLQSLMNETDGYSLNNNYRLGANIDMNGVAWTAKTLKGNIDGQGYTISNLTVSSVTENAAGMFSVLKGTIKNLKLTNFKVQVSAQYVGTVAGLVNNGAVVENVEVNGAYDVQLANDQAIVAGGITAVNKGQILGTTATINLTTKNAKLGGIAGQNDGIINDVTFNGDLITSNGTYLGGIAGESTNSIYFATANLGALKINQDSDNYVGGIAGATTGDIKGCVAAFSGDYNTNGRKLGGIAGKSSATIEACGVTDGSKLAGVKVAGFVSELNGGKVINSYTYAAIRGSEQTAGMANEFSNNAVVEKSYIATTASGSNIKYESNTSFRIESGKGSVSNNIINKGRMGSPEWRDSKRQYDGSYICGTTLGIYKWERNTPNDNLCAADACNNADAFRVMGWDVSATSIWNYQNGGPVLKSVAELKSMIQL